MAEIGPGVRPTCPAPEQTFGRWAGRAVPEVDVSGLARLTRELVQIRSYTGSAGEGDAGRFLCTQLRERGLTVRTQPVDDGRFNVIATLPGRRPGSGNSLMLNGHMDTNPVVLGWTRDPFAGEYDDDGWIYGLGVCNMKGALAAYIAAVDAVRAADLALDGDVVLAFVVGEQQGGKGTLRMLEEGVRSDYFIVGEPCAMSVLTMHSGAVNFRIHITGRMRHLSKAEEAVNAITKACDVIEAVRTLQFAASERDDYGGLRRVNISAIKGGMGHEYLDWRFGIVPDYCTISLGVRFAPDQSPDSVRDDLHELTEALMARDPDLHAEIELIGPPEHHIFPPFEIELDEPIVQLASRCVELASGAVPEIGAVAPYRFYGTDAAHLSRAGMQGVVCGPGGKQTTKPDEAMHIDELTVAARTYAAAIAAICGSIDD